MADYTFEEVMTALRNADKAGDAESATRLAAIANDMQQAEKAPVSGKAAAQKKAGVDLSGMFTYDPSKVNSATGRDYARNIATGAATGGAVGLGAGLISGPGAIVTGLGGALGGAAAGFLGTAAKDLGLGEGFQFMAEMAAPQNTATNLIRKSLTVSTEKYLANKAGAAVGQAILGVPKSAGSALLGALERRRPVDVKAASKTLQEEAQTLGIGGTKNIDETTAKLTQQHSGIKRTAGKDVSHDLYESAKVEADKVAFPARGGLGGEPFAVTPEFDALTKGIPANKDKFGELFLSKNGNPETGSSIVNNLQFGKEGVSYSELQQARKAFNDYLERTTGKRGEEVARKAFETERIALAKDSLPDLFNRGAANEIGKQLGNLGKTPEGAQVFKQELLTYLKTTRADDARKMWGQIGPDVKKYIIKDPAVYETMTGIINGARTQQELGRASRLLMRAAPVLAIESIKE
jgi:hypothetical protein